MSPSLNLVVIRVSDLEISRRFYEGLGIQFSLEQHGSGPEHLAAKLPGTVFEIYPRGNGPTTAAVRIGFRVESVVQAVAAAKELGAEIASPPKESAWGLRAVVVDADGHRVEISQ
jgi:catechol 2,3-dioxygenase-like lactoylglutathione lyase family enzyme